jgi:serine/threonine protein kinase
MHTGDVHTYLQTHPRTNRLSLLIGITAGLTFLHSFAPPIIHGDMKPVNILIDVSGEPRIADFGLSKLKGEITSFSTMGGGGRGERTKAPGTTRYMAPELFGTQLSVTLESDVWAWGMSALVCLPNLLPCKSN